MRRNISANIVSIGSMRIAEVREETVVWRGRGGKNGTEVEWLSDRPFRLFADDNRAGRVACFCDSS